MQSLDPFPGALIPTHILCQVISIDQMIGRGLRMVSLEPLVVMIHTLARDDKHY